ncbi:MAG: WhiB family transcriptional regulator [Actinomycetota bacterium]
MESASCARRADPDIHHPERGGSFNNARVVCARCPVTEECLSYALEDQDSSTTCPGGCGVNPAKQAAPRHDEG